jgi:hypothetical protein
MVALLPSERCEGKIPNMAFIHSIKPSNEDSGARGIGDETQAPPTIANLYDVEGVRI